MKQLLITDIKDEPFLAIPIDLPENMTAEETEAFKRLVQSGIRDALMKFSKLRTKQEEVK